MNVDPIEELVSLLGEGRDKPEPRLPRATWLGAITENQSRSLARADDDVVTPVPACRVDRSAPESTLGAVARWFDSWIRTVLTGGVAGSLFGLLYWVF
jgi:hypothetical protein